jgi:Carboxypeptidase regulatory-like domain/TonB dependent receptor
MRSLSSSSRIYRWVLCLTFIFIIMAPRLFFAQGYFGTVSGILTDPSGAIVQGAKVTLLDEEKGYKFTTTSNNEGRYLFVSIPPGLYSVSAEMKGFEKTVRTHVRLNISENPTANLTMKVASATQTVEVKSQATSIETQDAVTGQVVDRRLIDNLPLINRNVQDLIYLAPGVTDQSDQNSVMDTNGTNFISNGSRGASADILMDGASVTNFEPNGGITYATYVPSPEAVEEFKVQQSNFSAEYGFSGGSIVNMVTRSGTNSFHGEVYDFIRNTITDANSWFNDNTTPITPIPPVHRHEFGGTFGGPIIKNKTFFFFDWDGTLASSMSTYFAGVPSAAERTGNFSELCGGDGPNGPAPGAAFVNGVCNNPAGQLYDPYSGVYSSTDGGPVRLTPIPNNRVDQYISPGCNPAAPGFPAGNSCPPAQDEPTPGVAGNLIDPVASKMIQLFPNPTPGYSSATPYQNWIASGATPSNNEQFDIRVDHRFNQKNLLSGKYSQQWSDTTPYNCFKNFVDPCGSGANKGNSHLFALDEVYTISPTMLLTTTLGFTRGTELIFAYNSSLNPNPLSTLGFPSYLEENDFNGVPPIFLGDYTAAGFPNLGNNPYGNYKQGQETGQFTAMLTKIHGAHELKFGFEGRLHQQNYIQTNAPLGYFNFNYQGSAQCPASGGITGMCNDGNVGGGDDMASFLMGQMMGNGNTFYEIQFRPASENYQYAVFVQDNWKTTSKLTLNLGLRYDVSLPRTERFNRMNWWNPNVTNPLNGGSISYTNPVSGQPVTTPLLGGEFFNSPSVRSDWLTDWSDIQPRFGFAYQFAPKMVLRGGYGIFYSQTRSGANGLLSYGSQGFNQYTSAITTYLNQNNSPWLHLSNPFPNGLIQPPGSSLGELNDVGFGAIGPLRTHAAALTPYEQSWTLGIERQIPGNVVVAANYIGKKGTHLYFAGDNNRDILGPSIESLPLNPPNPNNPNQCQTLNVSCLESYVPNPFASLISNPNSTLSNLSTTVPYYQLLMPFPQYTSVTTDEPPIANSTYHALQLTANKAYSNGLELVASFTWSKSIDDSSMYDTNVAWLASYGPESGFALQDPNNPKSERALSTFDVPAMLKFSYSYDLPFGRGRAFGTGMPRLLDYIIGGWKTNGIWEIHSGRPLQFFVSGGGVPLPTYGPQRPNFVGKPQRNYGSDSVWVNNFYANASNTLPNSSIQAPAPFTLGNAPRTTADIRTPLSFTSDLSIAKQFLLSNAHEGVRLELRLEAQNAFNHPVFGSPDMGIGDGNFGVISYLAVQPRQCQLALKLNF